MQENGNRNSRYTNMSIEEFKNYLRALQESPFGQAPNDYFMWQKPDGEHFMIGIHSGQEKEIIIHEDISGEPPSRRLYGINPRVSYQKSGGGEYDPVDELVSRVEGYRYIGRWNDPDVLMESRSGIGREAAHGRFDLAKHNIIQNDLLEKETAPTTGDLTSQYKGYDLEPVFTSVSARCECARF